MKKLFIAALLFISITTFAQDTTKVEQYCKMLATGRLLSNKVTIDIDFGEERKLFGGDTRLKDEETGKLKKFNSVTDAMNYLGSQGWMLVNAFPMAEGSSSVYHFYFKKLFRKDGN
ncbi:MAG: hypothetical protein LH619_07020 [Chitinophagaceae bacterium]|nr:hypothetical protein [Chitinophagaceae bacterium]